MANIKKTKKAYEAYLNQLYGDLMQDYVQAQNEFGQYLKTKPKKLFGNKIHPVVIKHYNRKTLGTFERKYNPIGFHAGFNDWDPR